MAAKSKEQWQAEKLEILRYNRARIAARPNQDLWADQLAGYDAEIAATEAGNFYVPNTFQDQEAHAIALKGARKAA